MSKAKIVSRRGRQLTLAEKWAIDSRDTTIYVYDKNGNRVPYEELHPEDAYDDTDYLAEFEDELEAKAE